MPGRAYLIRARILTRLRSGPLAGSFKLGAHVAERRRPCFACRDAHCSILFAMLLVGSAGTSDQRRASNLHKLNSSKSGVEAHGAGIKRRELLVGVVGIERLRQQRHGLPR
jgi:hypothetical protein